MNESDEQLLQEVNARVESQAIAGLIDLGILPGAARLIIEAIRDGKVPYIGIRYWG